MLRYHGQTLIRRAAEMAIGTPCSPVLVVVGCDGGRISAELEGLPLETVDNPSWSEGMSTSLRAGISRLQIGHPEVSHALVMVCDQLHLTTQLLRQLQARATTSPSQIVAAGYSGVLGVPAIFPTRFFPNLLAIRGDQGARSLLEDVSDQIIVVPDSEAAVDIDTIEDARLVGLLEGEAGTSSTHASDSGKRSNFDKSIRIT